MRMDKKQKMTKFLSYLLAIAFGYTSLIYFLGNPAKGILEEKLSEDIILRRNFIINILSESPSASDFFQNGNLQYAGEWTIGTYAMATYALTNIAMKDPQAARESSQIIANWIEFCLNDKIADFDTVAWRENPLDEKIINGDRGHIGYYGHLNLMLGCYALLNNDGRFRELHKKISDAIARRMGKYPHRHIETYPYETYPPDNTVAAASLRVADMTLDTNYKALVDEWVKESKKIECQPYGLIAFQINSITGEPWQNCRGSNIGWNSFFMPLVDEEYAAVQFERFKKHMLCHFLGFVAFKEYPRGNLFRMDCDTGPVIFGLGGTATGFSVAGAIRSKDKALLSGILKLGELFGVSVTRGNERRYSVSPIVGDAIMLAMKTACRWEPLWRNNR